MPPMCARDRHETFLGSVADGHEEIQAGPPACMLVTGAYLSPARARAGMPVSSSAQLAGRLPARQNGAGCEPPPTVATERLAALS